MSDLSTLSQICFQFFFVQRSALQTMFYRLATQLATAGKRNQLQAYLFFSIQTQSDGGSLCSMFCFGSIIAQACKLGISNSSYFSPFARRLTI